MEKERRAKWLVIISLIIAVLGLTIAFAALSETLTINGAATLDAAKWGIRFENLTSGTPLGDAIVNNEAQIASDQVTINNINVSLRTPGDSVSYKVDLVNDGTINAEIYSMEVPTLTEQQKRYIDFKVTYENGEEVKQGDILNKDTRKILIIKIEFKKDITASDLPSDAQQINLSYKLEFVQTDEKEITEGSSEITGNYDNEIRSWNLSDKAKMTYYDGELQEDGTYDNGTLVISGQGELQVTNEENLLYKLADVSNLDDLELSEDGNSYLLKYNPTNLIIKEGITSIGQETFFLFKTLINVILPTTVTKIGDFAFAECELLKKIYMPNVLEIGNLAFSNCSSLTSIKLPEGITIANSAFSGCSSLTSIDLPKVTTIKDSAFLHCAALLNANIPEVTTIGMGAFYGCTSLENVNMSKVIFIENSAFMSCTSLKNINIPSSINSIGSFAFSYISDNSTIYVPDEKTKNKISSDSYDSSKTTIVVASSKFN